MAQVVQPVLPLRQPSVGQGQVVGAPRRDTGVEGEHVDRVGQLVLFGDRPPSRAKRVDRPHRLGVHRNRPVALRARLRPAFEQLTLGLDERPADRQPAAIEVGPPNCDHFSPAGTRRRCEPEAHGEILVHGLRIRDELADPLGRRWLDLLAVDLRLGRLDARIGDHPPVEHRPVERGRQQPVDLLDLVLARTLFPQLAVDAVEHQRRHVSDAPVAERMRQRSQSPTAASRSTPPKRPIRPTARQATRAQIPSDQVGRVGIEPTTKGL